MPAHKHPGRQGGQRPGCLCQCPYAAYAQVLEQRPRGVRRYVKSARVGHVLGRQPHLQAAQDVLEAIRRLR